uniref:gamma-glutamyl-gamma-aminobutyrate hydrolase family protein n=1 Tax=Mycobacterium sp. Marseille-P9652 TaxID=2654950 RepID=UPI001E5DA635
LPQHLPDVFGHSGHRARNALFTSLPGRTAPGPRLPAPLGESPEVRCHHHHAVAKVGPGLVVRARDADGGPARAARIIGYASMARAVLSFCSTLYWRVLYALHPNGGASDFGKQNIAVIATAVVYGVVALIAVLAASRWLLRATRAARLAAVALGASALVAGIIVWLLPVGRDIDAFHGIAQNTSTAGVGWEGYLAWAAAAALFAPGALLGNRDTSAAEENAWRAAARTGLALIAVWCLGSMVMRITDLLVSVSLNYPFSRYDSVVLAAFDLVTAVLAIWLRLNLANHRVSARLVSSLCGLVATLCVSRVVVGVALAPRFADSPSSPAQHPVYGNNLAQQITSTFDVTLCGLALCILAAAIITGHLSARLRQRRRAARARAAAGARPRARVPVGQQPGDEMDSPTTEIPQLAGAPRIFRGDDSATQQIPVHKPQIYRPPQP